LQQVAFQLPTLQLETVQVTGLNLSGGSFDLVLDVYNPNAYDIRTIRVETAIDLEETHFGDVAIDEAHTLPGTGHATVRVPVSFTWLGVGAAARGLLGRGAVVYTLDAQLMLDTPLGEQPAGFRLSGDVPIRDLIR
jgi:LEA14-like dessication related protein